MIQLSDSSRALNTVRFYSGRLEVILFCFLQPNLPDGHFFQWTDVANLWRGLLAVPPSPPADESFNPPVMMNRDVTMHFLSLNSRSWGLPHHYPFSLCVAVWTMRHPSCALMRLIMSPRSRWRGQSTHECASEKALECQASERYFPCHKEPYQNVIFITNRGDMPHCIRRKSDLMWCTAACQKQCYLGHPGSPICSVF